LHLPHPTTVCAALLYNITLTIHDGDMPDRMEATHAEVMQLWMATAGTLRADTAIQLIYDFGMDPATVLDSDQDFALEVLEHATKARAAGELMPTPPQKRPRSPDPSDNLTDARAPPRT
jgi:hypothetical protein